MIIDYNLWYDEAFDRLQASYRSYLTKSLLNCLTWSSLALGISLHCLSKRNGKPITLRLEYTLSQVDEAYNISGNPILCISEMQR
jgi:hypothetical protein